MDEIFLKVTSEKNEVQNTDIQEELLVRLANRTTLLGGLGLRTQQLRGAFVKCATHAARNWKVIAMQVILPAVMTILAIVQILAIPVIGTQPDLDLSLAAYALKENGQLSPSSLLKAHDDPLFGAEYAAAIGQDSTLLNLTASNQALRDWIPEQMAKDPYEFNQKYMIGMETFARTIRRDQPLFKFYSWFNGEAYHSVASSVHYASLTLAHAVFGDDSSVSISAHNHPLPATLAQQLEKNTSFTIQGSIIAFNLIIGIMIMFAAFTMLPVRERATGVKTMQKCSGAPLWLCWIADYLWDILNSLPPILVTLIIFAASQSIDSIKVT